MGSVLCDDFPGVIGGSVIHQYSLKALKTLLMQGIQRPADGPGTVVAGDYNSDCGMAEDETLPEV